MDKYSNFATKDTLFCGYIFYDSVISFDFYDTYLSKKITQFKFSQPNFSQLSDFSNRKAYYINKFKLYSYSIHEKKIEIHNNEKLKIFKSYSFGSLSNKILVLAEFQENNSFYTGFFIIDTFNNSVITSKIIETNNKSKRLSNSLILEGKFSKHKNIISYTPNKQSIIYLFDSEGNYIKSIFTKDNTPNPKVFKNNLGVFYDRVNTFNTNQGVFVIENKLFVISSRTKQKVIMIDIYSINSGKYDNSISFNYKNKTSIDVNYVHYSENKLLIYFDNELLHLELRN